MREYGKERKPPRGGNRMLTDKIMCFNIVYNAPTAASPKLFEFKAFSHEPNQSIRTLKTTTIIQRHNTPNQNREQKQQQQQRR